MASHRHSLNPVDIAAGISLIPHSVYKIMSFGRCLELYPRVSS